MKAPSRLAALTASLLVLLPALAVLQYRWVGQLDDATRERMLRNLHNAARQFQESFDGEVARAFVSLQVDSATARDEQWSRYAERHAAWAGTTAYPGLVANVFLIDARAGDLRLRRWDRAAGTFAPAEWTGALGAARAHFATELAAFATGNRRPVERRWFRDGEGLLVAPLLNVHFGPASQVAMHTSILTVFGFTAIELNLPLIRNEMLPALAQRHFSHTDGDGYRVAVVDAADAGTVIYRSSPEAPTDPSRSDVNMPIFGAHYDPVMFLARGAAREARDPRDSQEQRNLVLSVIRKTGNDNVTMRARIANADGGRWRLLAQHERGSLEAAVGGVRQRNLIVSFGILLLMGVSIGLLALSSRRAQHLAHQQMEFVAGVSHELRTPVAVIRSAGENLSHGVVGDPDRVRRYGDAIQGEARRLGEMIERVLQFAGIESGRVARAPIAIEPLVHDAIEAALPKDAGRFTVERHIAPNLPLVAGDATALRSAIQNLVTNAAKYGGGDRWIRIRVETGTSGRQSFMAVAGNRRRGVLPVPRAHRGQPSEVRVTIEDHGRGIAPADLPHIFDPFYRGGDATARQIQGSGLGLALVRRIAEAHGGRISVVTREGAGTAFTLHLPAAATSPEAVPLQSPNEAAAG
ncbi:MAG: sensor histidine kinase [Vicinamibacterales bacterium]